MYAGSYDMANKSRAAAFKVVLLITAETPEARTRQHRQRLAALLGREIADIKVVRVPADCEVPSALAAEHCATHLYADSSVSLVLPHSTRLARDWTENWFFLIDRNAQRRRPPLYQCDLKHLRR